MQIAVPGIERRRVRKTMAARSNLNKADERTLAAIQHHLPRRAIDDQGTIR
jgi:hypothetical protein